ncbi:MAG: hypothetical protein E7499_05895 [Ruminococcus sp.]|nr:hypothetical protein [Ruminococcus sp.]
MKVGETREVRLYHPATNTASNAYITSNSSNISYFYNGTDKLYITALEEGQASLNVRVEGCAFGAYVWLTILPADTPANLGDVDGSNTVDAIDASSVLAYYAIISTNGDASKYDNNFKRNADVNSDGGINAVDASLILAYYAFINTGGSGDIITFINNR